MGVKTIKIIENFYSSQIKISYIEQEIFYENEILKDYLLKQNIDLSEFGRFLASFDMRGEVLYRNLLEFSQGEKRKIALALSIYSKADFYIWDEPLNFLDLDLIEKMEDAILRDKPTMIFVEHDRNFVEKVATKIIEF
jgi:lincosamide and streptogramin A transport system ATP-binding/permease protein